MEGVLVDGKEGDRKEWDGEGDCSLDKIGGIPWVVDEEGDVEVVVD